MRTGAWIGKATALHDALCARYESQANRHVIGTLLVLGFLGTSVAVQLGRWGLLPAGVFQSLPASHLYAVHVAFTLLLLVEVVALVFSLGRSVANSVGTQFEIFSLILLRQTFEPVTHFREPVVWAEVQGSLRIMAADAAGALLIFVALGFYYRMQRHRPISMEESERERFILIKKLIALALLAVFIGIGLDDARRWLSGLPTYSPFEAFYTVLIFSDVLIVLVAFSSSSTYAVVFRNSGFAAATVLMRLALSAPEVINAALGLGAALFAVALTAAYNRFSNEATPAPAAAAPASPSRRTPRSPPPAR